MAAPQRASSQLKLTTPQFRPSPLLELAYRAVAFAANAIFAPVSWTLDALGAEVVSSGPEQALPEGYRLMAVHGQESGLATKVEVLHLCNTSSSATKALFVMIPGNPGKIDFYHDYLHHVHRLTGLECLGISHTGHTHNTAHHGEVGLDDQVRHKVDIIRQVIGQRNIPVILAGHSVGAYVALKSVNELEASDIHVKQLFCLFPTIHHIASTPNGRKLYPLLAYGRQTASHIMRVIVRNLPVSTQLWLAKQHMKTEHEDALNRAVGLFHPAVVNNCLYMAHEEMETINTMDEEHLRAIAHKLVWYFGQNDGWLTPDHMDDIASVCNESKLIFCDQGIGHAFVVEHSDTMAVKTAEWIHASMQEKQQPEL